MASIFSKFISYRKHLGNISWTINEKDINTQADLISEIESSWEQLSKKNYW